MPRPRASSRQQLDAFKLHKGGVGPSAIWEALVDGYGGDAVSLRTISTWVRGFKDSTEAREERGVPDLDIPFEWHRLEEYGLPWEASGYLTEMWSWANEFWAVVAILLNKPKPALPTVRQARWWWRVHLALPEVENKLDIYLWAGDFVRYELFKDVLGEAVDLAGLDAILAYKPWESLEKKGLYWLALNDGRIPFPPNIWTEYPLVERLREETKEPGLEVNYGVIFARIEALPSQLFMESFEDARARAEEIRELERKVQELEEQQQDGVGLEKTEASA